MIKSIMLGGAMAALSVSAAAQDPAPAAAESDRNAWTEMGERYYLTPSLSWVFADSGRETDDGQALSLAFGRRWLDVFALEAVLQYTRFDHEQGSDSADLIGLGVNGLFFPTKRIPAYLLLGAGYGEVSSHPGGDEDYGAFLLNVGGGYWWQPFDLFFKGLSLRTEAAYRLDAHNDRRTGNTIDNGRKAFGDLALTVGLNIPLGALPEPAPPPEPELVEVVAVAPPPDSDGDGVADDLDQCPGTPAGTTVDAAGCPVVSAPACKAPEPGEKLDLSGCASGDVIVLKGVNFEFNQSRLTANARTILDGVAEALQAAPTTNVEVGGHTDALGSDDYNQRLSERRACAVARNLVGQGVEAGRLTPAGHGETQPLADNETDEGRELNRRVELKILDATGTGLTACASAAPVPAASFAPAAPAEAAPAASEADMVEPAAAAEQATPAEDAFTAEPAEPTPEPELLPEPEPAAAAEPATPAPASAPTPASPSAPVPPPPAGSAESMQLVPESEVFGSDGAATAVDPAGVADGESTSRDEVQQVSESEVFGSSSAPATTEPAASPDPKAAPASGIQQVPESEVFESGN